MIDEPKFFALLERAIRHPSIGAALREALVVLPAEPVSTGLLSKSELARALSISPATIDRHDLAGAPFERVGSRKRYDLRARRAWLSERGKFTTVRKAKKIADDIDVTSTLKRGGLRIVGSAS